MTVPYGDGLVQAFHLFPCTAWAIIAFRRSNYKYFLQILIFRRGGIVAILRILCYNVKNKDQQAENPENGMRQSQRYQATVDGF